jgi:hypothetical protein
LPWFDPYAETNPASHSVERKTSMTASLTVAIPTFNRSRDAARLAGQIAPWTEDGDRPVHAVFYDDGSSDDTYARLQRYGRDNLRILRNDTNQGYARTLIRALSECDTEWVMLVADDDVFAPDPRQLQALMTWLHEEDPDFVCTQWLTSDGRLYRGRNSTEPIPDKSLRQAASPAPGLIYRSAFVRRALPTLQRELDRGSDAALVYPQVVLLAQMIAAGGKAMYWSGSLVREGSAMPSGIRDARGRRYSSPASRLSQALAFDRLFRQMEREAPDRRYRSHSRTFRRENEIRLARALKRILLAQFPRDMTPNEVSGTVVRSSLSLLRRNAYRQISRLVPMP